jgi:hypothetical protein
VGPGCSAFQEKVFVCFVIFSTDQNELTLLNPLMLLVLHKTRSKVKPYMHALKIYGGIGSKAPLILNLEYGWKCVVSFTHRSLVAE